MVTISFGLETDVDSYYQRQKKVFLDGTSMFQNEGDRQNEREVAELLEKAWNCTIRPFGAFSAVDWFAVRENRLVGVLELKSRPHESTKYPTVFLNVRKWLALSIATVSLDCPALFIVRFTNGVFWVAVADIDARLHRIGGCTEIVKSHNDIEPIIEVRIEILKPVQ